MKLYIDEAWRGPLAWPVVCGLIVVIDSRFHKASFQDSKVLTHQHREVAYQQLLGLQKQWKILLTSGRSTSKFIDQHWIIAALRHAILAGIWKLWSKKWRYTIWGVNTALKKLGLSEIVLDGNHMFGLESRLDVPIKTIIKGDRTNRHLSMASIIAKVERDRWMSHRDRRHPGREMCRHKGYGTALHREYIKQKGMSSIHRKSFCQNVIHEGYFKASKGRA